MTLIELTGNMYYHQKIRIFEVDKFNALKRKLVYEGDNHGLRSCLVKPLYSGEVIGFGVGPLDNVIDINVQLEV